MIALTVVLSAVDAHTAHALMENCLKAPILHGRTVLLVSHHTTLVSPAASYIVALDNVRVVNIVFDAREISNFRALEMISLQAA